MSQYLEDIKKNPKANTTSTTKAEKNITESQVVNENSIDQIPDNFGELYHKLPKTLSNVDKLLVAGFFVQKKSESNSFTIKDANDLLIHQGVKLSNPNAFNQSNSGTKRVFKLTGKNYRVSDTGIEAVKSMFTITIIKIKTMSES
jgi:hypothetical protein